jgi:dolichyl-phosphate-mannose--protein O-mannosyl transferase
MFPDLGTPRAIVFDETYLIPRAQAYINGIFFQESHPPLGRLVIALGQKFLHSHDPSARFAFVERIEEDWPQDIDISGYRLFPAIFGTINPVLVFWILLILTSNEWLALFASILLTFDNALVTQSRFALSDSSLIAFCLAAILCFVWLQSRNNDPDAKEYIVWGLFGAFASAAFLVKFTGLFVLIVFPFYLHKLWSQGYGNKLIEFLAIFVMVFLIVFVSIWQIHFSLLKNYPKKYSEPVSEPHQQILTGSIHPNPIQRLWIEIQDSYQYMLTYHKNVPALDLCKADEIGSPWYYWLFGGRAIQYRWEKDSEIIRIIYLVGNPIVWLTSLLGVIGATATIVANGMFRFIGSNQNNWLGIFTLLYWGYMLPISMVSRVMYLYHYLLPMIIGVTLFALLYLQIKTIPDKTKQLILIIVIICTVSAFWVYRPFTYYLPLTFEQFAQRNIWPIWDMYCPYCEIP